VESRVHYALVGLFVLVLGGVLAGIAAWLGLRSGGQEFDTYLAYMSESVAGLNLKASVKYRGVEVGHVAGIELDRENPERVRLTLAIAEGTPIKTDTRAILSTQGITGLAYVDLTGGSRNAPPLVAGEGEPYPEIRSGPSLLVRLDQAVSELLEDMARAATQLETVAQGVNALLAEENRQTFARTLGHVERVSGVLAGQVDSLGRGLQDASQLLGSAARVSAELPGLVSRVGATVEEARGAVSSIQRAAAGVERIVGQTERQMEGFSSDTLSQLAPLLAELRALSETLSRVAGQLERDPEMLLFGRSPARPGPGE
jgi:phospholipid/cholesterol/gamma-HCH transport system substrate-binding protein